MKRNVSTIPPVSPNVSTGKDTTINRSRISCVISGQPVIPGHNGRHTNIGPVHDDSMPEYTNMVNTVWHEFHGERCDLSRISRKIARRRFEGREEGVTVEDAIADFREARRKALNGRNK